MKWLAWLIPVAALLAQHEPKPPVGSAPTQPVPYSHKVHLGLGLKCVECHKTVMEKSAAGLPAESLCMNCHRVIKTESPAIRTLAQFHQEKKTVPWVRVYLLPNFVYFSHKRHHVKARIECAECHGDLASQEVVRKEKPIGMSACMACHDQRKANNNCDACHVAHPQ